MTKKNILLIDDSLDLHKIVPVLLKGSDYHITCVIGAAKALEELKNNFFDVILCDYEMPEMSGQEFVIKWRGLDYFNPKTKVIVTTAHEESFINTEDFDGYFNKPILRDKLIKFLDELLS